MISAKLLNLDVRNNIQLIIFAMLYNLANVHLSSTNEIFFLGRGIKPSVPSFLPQLNLSSTLLC